MSERIYSISEAASMVEVETHVLRYWEEELDINIRRNDMGHRCYSERDIKILQRVKTLKDKGIQLKAIKELVHKMYDMLDEKAIDTVRLECEGEELMNVDNDQKDSRIVDFKMAQFQNMMDKIVSSSIKENLKLITQSVSAAVSDDVIKQMDVLIKEKEEQEEARYRKLDSTIRGLQESRREIAATEAERSRKGFFRRKKKESL
ncbi:MAG: helix-turn-helix domain-containing protein [Clostridiales bacterium]|nr:helix-turn-helix domain-containing protein [Clostridiales bacterium]